jgi:hypothetical protein
MNLPVITTNKQTILRENNSSKLVLSGPAFLKCGGNKVNTSGDIKIYIQVF